MNLNSEVNDIDKLRKLGLRGWVRCFVTNALDFESSVDMQSVAKVVSSFAC